jgi:hypothetical protein
VGPPRFFVLGGNSILSIEELSHSALKENVLRFCCFCLVLYWAPLS